LTGDPGNQRSFLIVVHHLGRPGSPINEAFPLHKAERFFWSSGPVGRSERSTSTERPTGPLLQKNGDFKSPLLEVYSTNASYPVFRSAGYHSRVCAWRATAGSRFLQRHDRLLPDMGH
jgi:hypothetical protein